MACLSAMLSRMHREVAPGSSGVGCPVRRQNSSMRAGISPGAANDSSSGSISDRSGGAASARVTKSSKEWRRPAVAHARRDSWRSHSPVTFLSRRKVPETPPSFVRLAA
jgi:hypothetical protein